MLDREQDKAINESMKQFREGPQLPGFTDEDQAEALVRGNVNRLLANIEKNNPQSVDEFKSYARGEVLRWGKENSQVTSDIAEIMYQLLLKNSEIEQPAVQ